MTRRRLAALALALALPQGAGAASLTPPNLVTASTLNNQDLLLVWPYAAGGPLEAMSWAAFTAQMQAAIGGAFLTPANNLSDLSNQTLARTNLGLGTAATVNTGTSGSTLCPLNANCTISGTESHTGKLLVGASSTAGAGLNLAAGVAPSSPSNGDVWTTSSGVFARINGVTQQLSPTVSGTFAPVLAYQTPGTSSFSYSSQEGSYSCSGGVVSGHVFVSFTPTNGTASGNLLWTNPPYNIQTTAITGTGRLIGFSGPVDFANSGWASLAATTYLLGAATNTGTTALIGTVTNGLATDVTTSNSTSGSAKSFFAFFTYQTSTGTC